MDKEETQVAQTKGKNTKMDCTNQKNGTKVRPCICNIEFKESCGEK